MALILCMLRLLLQDEATAEAAIQAMNGFELAGRRLKVGPANAGVTASAAAPGALAGGMLPTVAVPVLPSAAAVGPPPAPAAPISRTILLENLVGPEEVDDDLVGEIKEECEKYGKVEDVAMLPFDPKKPGEIVKAAVTFAAPSDAAKAITNLHRRYFGGRVISARPHVVDAPAV